MTGKTILIGLGGTGARVVEAAVMAMAAGMGPAALSVLLIDSDGAHGNGERTAQLLTRYHQFRHAWTGSAHIVDYSAGDAPDFGRAVVQPLLPHGRWQWTPPPEVASLSVIAQGAPPPLLHALFLPNGMEAGRQVQHGLGGRAHVGAGVFGALFADAVHPVTRSLREALADGARVVMVGSGFGGTGVGAMMALHMALRGAEKRGGSLHAMVMPPYFEHGEDAGELTLRTQLAERALRAAGVLLLPMAASDGLSSLPNHGRSGRAQCNPSMAQELTAAAGLLAHLTGEEPVTALSSADLHRLHHLIRFCQFNLYETQVRLRAKGGLFAGNWALAIAGKVDPSLIGEPINLLGDLSRRVLEWAGSLEAMAGNGANLGWHIAPFARDAMPVTDAPRQGVQMIHPASLTAPKIAAAFDQLLGVGAQAGTFADVLHKLKRKPPVSAGHRSMGRALVAVHHALGEDSGL